jgi:hypothetical protein
VSEQTASGPPPKIRRRPGQAPSDHSQAVVAEWGSRVRGAQDPIPVFAAFNSTARSERSD